MTGSRSAREVFDEWGRDARADEMAAAHWTRVRQAIADMPAFEGDYLEIGVGNGACLRHMATGPFAGRRCTGLDISPVMADRARRRTRDLAGVTVENADFLAWTGAGEEGFGLIFSMEVFYYFPSVQAGIEKAFALLRPGGELWVLVDYYLENPASHGWPGEVGTAMQLWSMADYRRGFRRAGFEEVSQTRYPGGAGAAPDDAGTLCTRGRRPAGA